MQKIGDSSPGRHSEDISCSAHERCLLGGEYLSSHGAIHIGSDCRPVMDKYFDESESDEIFRVKRRSSVKAEKRTMKPSLFIKHSDNQVLFLCNRT